MDDITIARGLHILGVVFWIGGVAMVTTVLLPAIRGFTTPEKRVSFFEQVESRFVRQARYSTLLTGLSGFYMLYRLDAWDRYTNPDYWWVHAMTAVWIIFTLMIFVFEPLFLHNWFLRKAKENPEKTFTIIYIMHWVLLTISLITIFGALLGAHGAI